MNRIFDMKTNESDKYKLKDPFDVMWEYLVEKKGERFVLYALIEYFKQTNTKSFHSFISNLFAKVKNDYAAAEKMRNKSEEKKEIDESDEDIGIHRIYQDRVDFKRPLEGPSGAKLIAYAWQNKKQFEIDRRGEEVVRKYSDWDNATTNPFTNRNIVHWFFVVDANGETHTLSAESAAEMLGLPEAKLRRDVKGMVEDELSGGAKSEEKRISHLSEQQRRMEAGQSEDEKTLMAYLNRYGKKYIGWMYTNWGIPATVLKKLVEMTRGPYKSDLERRIILALEERKLGRAPLYKNISTDDLLETLEIFMGYGFPYEREAKEMIDQFKDNSNMNENTKITLTIGQLKRLVNESSQYDETINAAVDAMYPDFEPYSHYVSKEYFEQRKNEKREKLEQFMASSVPKTPNELRKDLDFLTDGHYFSFDDFSSEIQYKLIENIMDSAYNKKALSIQLRKLFAAKYKDSEQIAVVVIDRIRIFRGLYLYISKDGSPLDKNKLIKSLERRYDGTCILLN